MEWSIYFETCVSLWALDIENSKNDNVLKVNGHRLKAYFDEFPSENESIGLNDLVDKGWLFCFSHIIFFCVLFLCDFCFASFSHPGQMADNGTPWLLSRLFQFPMITDICVYICAILCSFSFLWISPPILSWKWTPLLKNWKGIFPLCLRMRLQKFTVLGVKDWGC